MIEKNINIRTELLKWVVCQIVEGDAELTWVTNHVELIVKSHLSFSSIFWWAIIQSRIRPTFIDNVITMERVVLLASILASYEIDWAVMAE